MLERLAQMDMSIYFQTVVFVILLTALLRLHWKMGSFMHIVLRAVKYCLFILVFIYLFLNWASDVNPTLRSSSILIMTLINLYMLWQTLIASFELPYRRSLHACVDGACTASELSQTFSLGKRYYKFCYLWASFSSSLAPWSFLRGIAAERTRDDLHRVFAKHNPQGSLFGGELYFHFLTHRLGADKSLSDDQRATLRRNLEGLAKDPWLTKNTGDFLNHLLTAPEDVLEAGLKASSTAEKPA